MSDKEIHNELYAIRLTEYQGSLMINICDIELVGSRLQEGELLIDITKEYFQQEIIEAIQAEELLRTCSIANLVGERIVSQAVRMNLAKERSIRRISGIPFLMIFKFHHKY
ncbi:MAG TPA: DUF424 family protein [Nitrososphaeraceae archaeon]|nr:DUF424 family protein [Nitrososphaeraceae archaeon]